MTERGISFDREQMRVCVLAPTGRDAAVTANVLAEEGLSPGICASIDELCARIAKGSGAAIIAAEALGPAALNLLVSY
jgi:two-component system, sensor histidine kinase